MDTKRSFWQDLTLQAIAPFMALVGVTISVRPDILGQRPDDCQKVMERMNQSVIIPDTSDDRAPPSIEFDDISPTAGVELPPMPQYNYDFSVAHLGILIACLILLVQVIRLYHNWK